MIEEWAREVLRQAGYTGLAALILIENLFPPIPSELILPLAGYLVATGQLAYVPAVAAATVGSVGGAVVIYWLARLGGHPLLLRMGRVLRVREAELDRGEALLRRHGIALVFFGRLLPGVRSLVSVPAGVARVPFSTFLLFTTLGSSLWNALLIGAGVLLREAYHDIAIVIEPVSRVLAAALVILFVAWLWRRRSTRSAV